MHFFVVVLLFVLDVHFKILQKFICFSAEAYNAFDGLICIRCHQTIAINAHRKNNALKKKENNLFLWFM